MLRPPCGQNKNAAVHSLILPETMKTIRPKSSKLRHFSRQIPHFRRQSDRRTLIGTSTQSKGNRTADLHNRLFKQYGF
jgi:hypothetical protein